MKKHKTSNKLKSTLVEIIIAISTGISMKNNKNLKAVMFVQFSTLTVIIISTPGRTVFLSK